VTGAARRPRSLCSGAQAASPVLTPAHGSGVLMAAHMEGSAKWRDVASGPAEMTQLQRSSKAFHLRHAHAIDDVNGFGLAGHIAAICRHPILSAEKSQADAVPAYAGARKPCQSAAVQSSLFQPKYRKTPRTAGAADPCFTNPNRWRATGGVAPRLTRGWPLCNMCRR